jgi:peptidoglycan-N-acetylglucosamine deacetylase
MRNEPLLKSLMGKGDWHWFRYPFLHEGETVEKRRAERMDDFGTDDAK